jgi:DNA anti-recombination protein RmuC
MDQVMSQSSQPHSDMNDDLEAAVDQAISACGGDLRAAIRALIVANEYLETEVSELMKAVSHAYTRGRFNSYSG